MCYLYKERVANICQQIQSSTLLCVCLDFLQKCLSSNLGSEDISLILLWDINLGMIWNSWWKCTQKFPPVSGVSDTLLGGVCGGEVGALWPLLSLSPVNKAHFLECISSDLTL